MELKQINHSIKALDEATGEIEAYANVYNNIDSDEDLSLPGSFTKTTTENFKRIRVFRNHWTTERLGIPRKLDPSDPYGLMTTTQFNMKKDIAKDMFWDCKMAMDNNQNAELSIGYEVMDSFYEDMNGIKVRKIREYKLYEYSFLDSWAANPLAIVTGIKSKDSHSFIELLTKSYNLPYSDTRLIEVEKILKSLTATGPGTDTTSQTKPTFDLSLLIGEQKSFNLNTLL